MSTVLVDLDDLADDTAFYVEQVCVPLITCKDCKYYRRIELNSCDEVVTFCEKHNNKNSRYLLPNFYCADGERKE